MTTWLFFNILWTTRSKPRVTIIYAIGVRQLLGCVGIMAFSTEVAAAIFPGRGPKGVEQVCTYQSPNSVGTRDEAVLNDDREWRKSSSNTK